MKKNSYTEFFEKITPSEELTERTLIQMKKAPSKPPVKAPRRITAAAMAACAVIVCGVSAAAIGGYIDFDSIFGNYIKADNSELADSLIGTVSDVKYKVSDSNYKISVKGAAGDDSNIIVVAELSRVDGTPVTDHFAISCGEEYVTGLYHDAGLKTQPSGEKVSPPPTTGGRINKSGNIELYTEIKASENIDGCEFFSCGKNFYPSFSFMQFRSDNKVYYVCKEGKWDWFRKNDNGHISDVPADVDDSAVKLLDLEWEFSFTYNVPENALEKKVCDYPAEACVLYDEIREVINIGYPDGSSGGTSAPGAAFIYANTAVIKHIEADALKCRIEAEYPVNEYMLDENGAVREDYVCMPSAGNKVYLIVKDGKKIPLRRSSSSLGWGDTTAQCEMTFCYSDDTSENILTEISDVTAISVNGTVYELK